MKINEPKNSSDKLYVVVYKFHLSLHHANFGRFMVVQAVQGSFQVFLYPFTFYYRTWVLPPSPLNGHTLGGQVG